jgi:hemoglobin-like flavoprotein
LDVNTEIIGQVWDSLEGRHQELVLSFYERFFQRFPHYRSLFPEQMDSQMRKMVHTLALVARVSDSTSVVTPHLEKVGSRHRGYHISADDLQNFKEVFLEVLQEKCGDVWSDDCRQAWDEAFEQVLLPHMARGLYGPSPRVAYAH